MSAPKAYRYFSRYILREVISSTPPSEHEATFYETIEPKVELYVSEWQPIETAPEGEHLMFYWPYGEKGVGGIECATMFRGDPHSQTEMSFWTHGGPNSGSDWEPRHSEKPTHWMPLPKPPQAVKD